MAEGRPTLSHQGRTTALSPGESLIGSSSECTIRIEGQGIAPVHAAVTVEGAVVLFEDRSPDQETRVNDQRVSVVEIEAGRTLRFGEIELQLVREDAGMALQGAAGSFSLATGENKVGRAPDCRVQIDDASISRYHATILVLPKKVLVKDLGSTNGTLVDGSPVGVVELASGDRLKLGEVEATFAVESVAEPVMFQLVVDGGSRVLSPGELKIGRAPDCKISFSEDSAVSRYHAQITVGADMVRLKDLGSSNGTFVNGTRISTEIELKNEDRIEIGEHSLVLQSKVPVDPLGKTIMAGDLGGLVDKTVLMQKGPATPSAAPASQAAGPWAVLDLPQGTSEDQIRQRYQERFSEYQVRLTNAPTPRLKEKYNQKLQELREAFTELVPDAAGAMASDLPSAKPVEAPNIPPPAIASEPEAAMPEAADSPPPPGPPPAAAAAQAAAPEPEIVEEKQPLPKSAFVMAGLGVLAIGLAVVMTMLLLGAKKTEATLAATLDEKLQSIERMRQEIVESQANLEELQGGKALLLENKPFKVCNLSEKGDLRILWLAVAYVDEAGQLASFDSAFVGYPDWKPVGPGGSSKFDFVSDDEVIWDGSALFFSMLFKHRGKEYHRSGSMQNVPDDCYKLALDGM
jgi:pSer/pThr/pTyr-binding forkhead associated (FHA) protein